MKSTSNTTPKIIALLMFAVTGLAYASGTHSGGHGHDTDETMIGKPGTAGKVTRTITINMGDDMRYTPSAIQVNKNETVRFIVKNKGQIKHELSLGTEKDLLEHLEAMKKYPDMEHDEPGKVTLAPGNCLAIHQVWSRELRLLDAWSLRGWHEGIDQGGP